MLFSSQSASDFTGLLLLNTFFIRGLLLFNKISLALQLFLNLRFKIHEVLDKLLAYFFLSLYALLVPLQLSPQIGVVLLLPVLHHFLDRFENEGVLLANRLLESGVAKDSLLKLFLFSVKFLTKVTDAELQARR